jgi:hypothetical protein
MIRLLASLLIASGLLTGAWTYFTKDRPQKAYRADNDAALRERMILLRQRLAHPEETDDEEVLYEEAAAVRRRLSVPSERPVVGQRAAPESLQARTRNIQ